MPLKLWSRSCGISTTAVIFCVNAGLLSLYVGGPCTCRNSIGEHNISIQYCDFTVCRSSTPLDPDSSRCPCTRVPPGMSMYAKRDPSASHRIPTSLGTSVCLKPGYLASTHLRIPDGREECTITMPSVRGVNRAAARDVCARLAISILQIGCLARSHLKKGENQERQRHVSKRSQ